MHRYSAHVAWTRGDQTFVDNRYRRRHTITFDGGAVIAGSSSPQVVREPLSDPSAVDPEEAFVASLASCHMLWFLNIAATRGYRVDAYTDRAEGVMDKGANGKLWISAVTLKPEVVFSGEPLPTTDEFLAMHHAAHDECFLANSVLTRVGCEPVMRAAQ